MEGNDKEGDDEAVGRLGGPLLIQDKVLFTLILQGRGHPFQ
jgi:hypothetical protein